MAGIDELAASLWYPIWDARLGLDHSVRTLAEALSVAHDDVKVSLGLLDARHVAGDADAVRRAGRRRAATSGGAPPSACCPGCAR